MLKKYNKIFEATAKNRVQSQYDRLNNQIILFTIKSYCYWACFLLLAIFAIYASIAYGFDQSQYGDLIRTYGKSIMILLIFFVLILTIQNEVWRKKVTGGITKANSAKNFLVQFRETTLSAISKIESKPFPNEEDKNNLYFQLDTTMQKALKSVQDNESSINIKNQQTQSFIEKEIGKYMKELDDISKRLA